MARVARAVGFDGGRREIGRWVDVFLANELFVSHLLRRSRCFFDFLLVLVNGLLVCYGISRRALGIYGDNTDLLPCTSH